MAVSCDDNHRPAARLHVCEGTNEIVTCRFIAHTHSCAADMRPLNTAEVRTRMRACWSCSPLPDDVSGATYCPYNVTELWRFPPTRHD